MEINSATLTNYYIHSPADIPHEYMMLTIFKEDGTVRAHSYAHTQEGGERERQGMAGGGEGEGRGLKSVPLCSTKISLMLTHATHHGRISLKGCICWLGSYIIDNGSTWCRRDECRMGSGPSG